MKDGLLDISNLNHDYFMDIAIEEARLNEYLLCLFEAEKS